MPPLLLAAFLSWSQLAPLPDAEGFAGAFAGATGGGIIVAGGANFPAGRPWEGGRKAWHDGIFFLGADPASAGPQSWRRVGRLPRPLAYGASVPHRDMVVCVGGSGPAEHHRDVFTIAWNRGTLDVTMLPPLPRPLAQHCAAVVGDHLYVAGGTEAPAAVEATRTFLRLDLASPSAGWKELDPWPGPGRILATAGTLDGAFLLVGGAGLQAGADAAPSRIWLRDAYRYTPGVGWRRIADLPRPAVAAPSPAPAHGSRLLILGGDDGGDVATPHERHPGFRRDVLVYDGKEDRWSTGPDLPFALVTTPAFVWQDALVIPGGEVRPGVRSTTIWQGRPAPAAPPRNPTP